MIIDLQKRLDNIWNRKNKLEKDLKILFQQIECIPELENPDNSGSVTLNQKQRSKLFDRIRYLKLIELYRNIVMCCDDIGYNVYRDKNGKHTVKSIKNM